MKGYLISDRMYAEKKREGNLSLGIARLRKAEDVSLIGIWQPRYQGMHTVHTYGADHIECVESPT
jgi:hypothetical protein